MKKIMILCICLTIVLALVGCAGAKAVSSNEQSGSEAREPVVADAPEMNPTPSDKVDRLFAAGDITLTLHLANEGACSTYPANERYSDRFKELLDGYKWTMLKMPLTEPSEFWLTAASADGTIKMTIWSNSGAGMVQYADGNDSSFWSAEPADDSHDSIASDIRMEYDSMDVNSSHIA